MNREPILIDDYDYDLPDGRIAKFPLADRDASRLLLYRQGEITEDRFSSLSAYLPADSLLVFNNTKVVRARIVFFKETGARVEIFCLEPHEPADHERAFAQKGSCAWKCIVGNSKKWKDGELSISFDCDGETCRLSACRIENLGSEHIVAFRWDGDLSFGRLLERLGRIPIPPYLCRESEALDNSRYQTVYSKFEGSVAAPTAGLHFTDGVIRDLRAKGVLTEEVTLHVGAGTFLPVKSEDAVQHTMHTEHFEATLATLKNLFSRMGHVIAVGTTSVRTLESLAVLGYRTLRTGTPDENRQVGQWEAYDIPENVTGKELVGALIRYMEENGREKIKSSTRIMITPSGFRFRIVNGLVTNFHQPKSTLLLLISALVGGDWKKIYDYALKNEFRFLSYGDSSLLFPPKA